MRIGITYDLREDYGIDRNSQVFADFCSPDEIGYMADSIRAIGHEPVMIGNMYRLNRMILDHTITADPPTTSVFSKLLVKATAGDLREDCVK